MHDLVRSAIHGFIPSRHIMREVLGSARGVVACGIVGVVLLSAIAAPAIAPNSPVEQDVSRRLEGPSLHYPLGTDALGRCQLSRIVYGARISLTVSILIVGVSAAIGVFLGTVAGYAGGVTDRVIMRAVDVFLSFPGLVLAIVLAGVIGPGLGGLILALMLVHWTAYARVTRGEVLRIREELWVDAARVLGSSQGKIIRLHILPGVFAPVLVMASFGLGHMILAAGAMSFLGLGAQPPAPEWGAMLNRGRDFMRTAPMLMMWPGLAITITVLGFNLLGDVLHEAFHAREENIGEK